MLDRRALLTAAALAPLAACTRARPQSVPRPGPTACLPRVEVARERVIRTLAGLRPFRASGFVVRAEALAGKRLVHNYGHGGAGITLSWGTARLATQLGLPGHSGPVAVIGAGVAGLTTARLVQEAGFPVTVYAAALPPETTSNVAGGQFHPFGHFREHAVTPEWREQFRAAVDYSWRRFQIMVGEDYGIRWLPTFVEADSPETQLIPTFPPINRVLAPAEHPFALDHVARYDTLYVEPGRFLRQMIRDIESSGGRFAIRNFASPADVAALDERLVFNCTGLGARALFGDEELRPARGQLAILLPQPEIRYALTMEAGYMFPRPDGIVLGGTFELDKWSTEPDPARIERILESHRQLFAGMRCVAPA
jgi:glycine/D-amino acid oxidase-like deaminating enzyme